MTSKAYDTDLNDQEWAKIEPYFFKHRTYKWSEYLLMRLCTSLKQAVNGACSLTTFLFT